jgi:drug/metabolite transporter (DMT)-like permease
MQLVIRLYWWMGVIGLAIYVGLTVGGIWANWSTPPQGLEWLLALVASAAFVCSLVVSQRLAKKPKGILAAANWVALIIAVAWFPWMTVPAIVCRRRLHLYYAAYCESVQADREKPA